MIRQTITGSWGVDILETEEEDPGDHAQINVFDDKSNILTHIPFNNENVMKLIVDLARALTDDQRRELAPVFTSGIVLPGSNFDAAKAFREAEEGPQG